MHSFIVASVIIALSTSAYGACPAFKTTTTNGVTVTGPFALTAGDGEGSWVGKYARSGPPDGSCCNNFFVFGIPADRVNDEATNFYLTKEGQLISIQNNVVYTAYENNPNDPLDAHVLLGTPDDFDGNPTITCSLSATTCALSCSVSGYSYSCLGSPGYQPDWRIAQAADGAGPGCAPFNPIAVAPSTNDDGGLGALASAVPSSSSASVSASASASGSSSSAAATTKKKNNNNDKATPTSKLTQTTVGEGGFAKASAASSSAVAQVNLAIRTAAPVVAANAAIALGIFAAL